MRLKRRVDLFFQIRILIHIDCLNKYFTLKLLDDRRLDLTKQLTTMKILGEEVRVFLIDCFFVGIVFTDNCFFKFFLYIRRYL